MRNQIYRSQDKRVIFGICQGVAEYFDLSVFWIRFALVVATFFTGLFPIPVFYGIAALVIKPEPESATEPKAKDSFEEDYFETEVSSRTLSLRRLKNRFDSIESRIQRMENYVTNKSYDWERRFNSGK
ncbi:envelope stress response membrane protein PspC [Pelagicoccus albus]|uniref:Envelope stress response membrane protein PspC n=1 Tax=Pelagicoccus albus TaxID=415222 RepID=A0A7X1B5B0_9BACT|nr:envelope stress response membrane protein PspC [Pelagicoccus albus]MBC2605890.1 envelope stress response membrane protein PspC [Pelagicoccus albus]